MPSTPPTPETPYDLLIIGGGVNGCGIARDAAGRGLTVVLAEMNDLASAASSASTKLFHGGLRYLEYFELRLVREALIERETLLRIMPHISWPMRFVLPLHEGMRFSALTPASRLLHLLVPWTRGKRPAWLIRLGLWLYDHLGGRKILPGTSTLDLTRTPEGAPLKSEFTRAYEYSDCWIEDSRLVILNARDAEARGAEILTRTRVVSATRENGLWRVSLEKPGARREVLARCLINAGGAWVDEVIRHTSAHSDTEIRLVRGSHIVTRRLFDHDKAYFFQGTDGRIIFALPYEGDFTLIGTTDEEHTAPATKPECTPEERRYLIDFTNHYFKTAITEADIVWTFSGIRPLYDDGARSATAATRDYAFEIDAEGGAPMLNIYGGKLTTYRRLSEAAMNKLKPYFPALPGPWTADHPLPGGDFPVHGFNSLVEDLEADYPFLTPAWAQRLARAYGTEAHHLLQNAKSPADLGETFGATLTERELKWLMQHEYARTACDVVWRRTRLGLRLSADEIKRIDNWMAAA